MNDERITWMEDESRSIGRKIIPEGIWKQMRGAPVVCIHLPFEERLKQIVEEYGIFPVEELIAATQRIERRLGPQHAKEAVEFLRQGAIHEAFSILLCYYDKAYRHDLALREKESIQFLEFEKFDAEKIAQAVIQCAEATVKTGG
jgi:tRNA 2-selenouridine synthase